MATKNALKIPKWARGRFRGKVSKINEQTNVKYDIIY